MAHGRSTRPAVAGLYAITPDGLAALRLLELVDAAIAGGARAVQYRDKSASAEALRENCRALVALCRGRGVPLIVNDHVGLAIEVGADGVHIGADDGEAGAARASLGENFIIGVSCYGDLARADAAVAAGCDYVAFGSVFASTVKPHAQRVPLSLFSEFRAQHPGLASVAIGGVDATNVATLIAAGANAAASIAGVFSPPQRDAVFANARRLSLPFAQPSSCPYPTKI
jgi:thiamine-phosphate pyrophosphorylase